MRQTLLPKGTAALLVILVVGSLALWAVTYFFLRDDHVHMGLLYNILLAALPLVFAVLFRLCLLRKAPRVLPILCGAAWLLFLPNAPYMATDLVHLQFYNYNAGFDAAPDGYAWLAWAQILGTVAIGCLLGCLAIHLIHRVAALRFGAVGGWVLAVLVSLVCGFGIYAGRFMRFHSVDIFKNPLSLFTEFTGRLGQGMVSLSLLFAAATLGGYILFYACFTAGDR